MMTDHAAIPQTDKITKATPSMMPQPNRVNIESIRDLSDYYGVTLSPLIIG